MAGEAPEQGASLPHSRDPVDVLDTPRAGNKAIRGGALRTVGYAVGVGLTALSAAVLIRHLGVVDWGHYVAVTSVIAIVGGLSEAGLSAIGVREYSVLTGAERDRLMRNLLGLRLGITAIGVALAVAFTVAARYERDLVLGAALSGGGLLFTTAQQTLGVPLSAGLRLAWLSALDIIRQAVTLALLVALVVAGARLLPFFAVPLPVGALLFALTAVLVRGTVPLRPAFERAMWARIAKLTAAYAAASAVGTIYVSITVVLTSLVGTARETGYYAASFRIFSVVAAIPVLVVGAAFPILARAARDDRERLEFALGRLLEVGAIVGIWFALCLTLGARVAIDLVAGSGFGPAVRVLQIQGAAIVATFVAVTLGFALLSLHRHTALLVANAVSLGLSIVLTVILVPAIGARGAATASLLGESALAISYGVALFRMAGRPSISLRIVPRAAAAALAALALLPVPGLHGLALVGAANVVYFAVLAVTRAIPSELRAAFVEVLPGRGG